MKVRVFFLAIFFICLILPAKTQVTGKVFDASNLNPINGATVIYNDSLGTTTDAAGYFSISDQLENKTIVVSFLGYQDRNITLKENTKFISVGLNKVRIPIESVYVKTGMVNRKLMQTPASLAMLGTDELDVDQGYSIEPVLNSVPGVKMHTGTYNTNRITIRGIGSRSPYATQKIRAYYNNIPLTNGSGESVLEDIDISQIGKIEIIKGPSSGFYGAGLGGSIHLFSPLVRNNDFIITTDNSLASFGTYKNIISSSIENINSNLSLNVVNSHSDGYRQNNEFNRKSALLTANFYSRRRTIAVLGHVTDVNAQIPSSIDYNTYSENPKVAAPNWLAVKGYEKYKKALLGINIENKPLKRITVNTGVYSAISDGYEFRPVNVNIQDEESVIFGVKSYLTATSQFDILKITSNLGIEYFMEMFDWKTYETVGTSQGGLLNDNAETRVIYNTFYQSEFVINQKFSISLSANLNATNYRIVNEYSADTSVVSGKYKYNPILSPRLGIVFFPTHDISFYALVSHGFSQPTLQETLYPNGSINLDIRPEQGVNYETGVRGYIIKNLVFADISMYTMHIKNLLVAKRIAENADAYVGINAGKTVHNGLEMFLKYQTPKKNAMGNSPLEINTNITISNYKFADFTDEGNVYDGNKIPGIAPIMVSSGIQYTFLQGASFSVHHYFSDKMYCTDDNSVKTDPYHLLNIKLAYKKDFAKNFTAELYGGINNILDTKYASMILINAGSFNGPPRYYYPGLPRNYYVGVKVGFGK